MQSIQFEDQEKAVKAFLANCSLRYLKLDALERWSTGNQYDELQSWWDDAGDVPLWERAPCIVYPVVQIAALSNVDMCLGEGRFPVFTTKPSEDEGGEDNGLSEQDSKELDRFIREYHRICRYKAHSRDAFFSAQACGSAAALHGVRNGKPFAELIPAKWCEPEFTADGAVATLEIRYPYTEEYKKPGGKWAKRTKIYRRVINETSDVEYLPADAREDGAEPSWAVNKARSVEHNFGFCPVVWYALVKGATTVNRIDGKAIHATITDEIHAHDIARSQWHRGALMSEPQICEFGVQPGYSPTEIGHTASIPQTEKGGEASPDNPIVGYLLPGGGQRKKARKKGPGWVWQYGDKDSRTELLLYPADALKAQQDNASDLRIKIQEALAVVFLDPENIKFAATTSGKALEAIKQKQLDRCDQYRDDLVEGFFEPSVSMQLRIAQVILKRGKGSLRVPGASNIGRVLDTFLVANDNAAEWQMPSLSVVYGPYFKPDPDEQQKIVNLVQAAMGGVSGEQLITLSIAVKKIAAIFGIENAQLIVEELEKLKLERQEQALRTAQATKPPAPGATKPESEPEQAQDKAA